MKNCKDRGDAVSQELTQYLAETLQGWGNLNINSCTTAEINYAISTAVSMFAGLALGNIMRRCDQETKDEFLTINLELIKEKALLFSVFEE